MIYVDLVYHPPARLPHSARPASILQVDRSIVEELLELQLRTR